MGDTRAARMTSALILAVLASGVSMPVWSLDSGPQAGPRDDAEKAGSVAGTVRDANGNPLGGVSVLVVGTALRTTSNGDGSFLLRVIPPGKHRLLFTYLSYQTHTAVVIVDSDQLLRHDAQLGIEPFAGSVTVHGEPLREAQAQALSRQKGSPRISMIVAADQLGRFPDRTAADALQRLPGVTVLRDQGEARLVLIRGLDSQLNSTMLNGERIPSTEADERKVDLDIVPIDLLEAIEVSKTLTPDMDGDAIGGAIDLVTRPPPRGRRVSADLAAGHDDASDGNRGRLAAVWGARATDHGGAGILLAASFSQADRGSDTVEVDYDEGEALNIRLQDNTVTRDRGGATAAFDLPIGETAGFVLRGVWSQFEDHELRRRVEGRIADGAVDRELKDRVESQTITSVSARSHHLVGTSILVEPRLTWSVGKENEPNRLDTIFVGEGIESRLTDPLPFCCDLEVDPEGFELSEILLENDSSRSVDLTGAVDLTGSFYRSENRSGSWKVGMKVRLKESERDDTVMIFENDQEITLADVLDTTYRPSDPFFGSADIGPFPDPALAAGLIGELGLEGEADPEEDLGDYRADEDTVALFAMLDIAFSDHLSIVGGIRTESTEHSYRAFEIAVDNEGELADLEAVTGGGSYSEILPNLQARYSFGDKNVVRAAITRSLARPSLQTLAPTRLVLEQENEILLGNPHLVPTTAWNFDLQLERYLEPLGLFSIGAFSKRISDTIVPIRISVASPVATPTAGGDEAEEQGAEQGPGTITEIQPQNAGDATLFGLEFAFQQRFASLPAPFDGLGLYLNYTWTESDASLAQRSSTSLVGQANHSGNIAVAYEKSGISARLAYNYHDQFLEEVGESSALDLWVDERWQLDLSLRYQAGKRMSLYAEGINLTDQPMRRFEGDASRPISEERNGWWVIAGLRLDF